MKIWTVGTSKRGEEEFIQLLKHFNISAVVDVRRFPLSRLKHFSSDSLEKILKNANIAYYLCEDLGGYRKGGYRKHMLTDEFKRGIEFVERIASERNTAILCAEKLFFKCHRRFIADALVSRGHEVIHIIDERRTQKHRQKESKLEV
ncbi:MAG: DUF488 domain-containing protein [Canidatus Methanoxibalbensis ujae]|nr:DUF488 domain-containing protein [Candidatus Methanoxibalbensis ujae]